MRHLSKLGALVVASILGFSLPACNAGRGANLDAAVLNVSAETLQFSAVSGQQSDPLPATIGVANSEAGDLTFSVATDAGWLAVTPMGGNAPESLQVTAMIGALAPGTYTGHVIIKSEGVRDSPAIVTVTFTIAPRAHGLAKHSDALCSPWSDGRESA
jgi:hypothetical protein